MGDGLTDPKSKKPSAEVPHWVSLVATSVRPRSWFAIHPWSALKWPYEF